ncbi:hypothetical protein BDW62DRAFT_171834 [Aspergillus aurantiobrunneus]
MLIHDLVHAHLTSAFLAPLLGLSVKPSPSMPLQSAAADVSTREMLTVCLIWVQYKHVQLTTSDTSSGPIAPSTPNYPLSMFHKAIL